MYSSSSVIAFVQKQTRILELVMVKGYNLHGIAQLIPSIVETYANMRHCTHYYFIIIIFTVYSIIQ